MRTKGFVNILMVSLVVLFGAGCSKEDGSAIAGSSLSGTISYTNSNTPYKTAKSYTVDDTNLTKEVGIITYEITSAPVSGITINSTTGEVMLDDTVVAGIYNIDVQVKSSIGGAATTTLRAIVRKINQNALSAGADQTGKFFDDANFTQKAIGGSGTGATSYASNDTNVADVNATTGEVTIVGAGTATITATKAANTNYYVTDDSYDITVAKIVQDPLDAGTDKPGKSFGDAPFTQEATGGSGTGVVTYDSNDTTVADVNTTGGVTIVGAGTATITANKPADSNHIADVNDTYDITVAKIVQDPLDAGDDITKLNTDSDFSTAAPTGGGSGVYTYNSSDTSVATIDTNGDIDVLKGGTTTITVTSVAGTNYTADVDDEYILFVQKQDPLTSELSANTTFTRVATADVVDFETITKAANIDEPRYEGARRVENLVVSPATPATQTISLVAGNEYQARIGSASTTGATAVFTGAFDKNLTADGTNSISFVDGVPIKANKGLTFDGTDDYISFATFTISGDFVFKTKVLLNNSTANQIIIGNTANGTGIYKDRIGLGDEIFLKDGRTDTNSTKFMPPVGTPFELEWSYNDTTNTSTIKFDGTPQITFNHELNGAVLDALGRNATIHMGDGAVATMYSAEIDTHFAYVLDKTSGTTATDSSANGNNGTLENGLVFTTGTVDVVATITGTINDLQLEDVSNQTNQNPSEFVDGVKSFGTINANTVDAGGTIADTAGAAINDNILQGLLVEETALDNMEYSFGTGKIPQSFALSMEVTPSLITYTNSMLRLFSTQDISTFGGVSYGYDNTTKTFTIPNGDLVQNAKIKFEFILKQIGGNIQAIIKKDTSIVYDNTAAGILNHSADGKLYIGRNGADYFTGNFKNILFTAE